MSKYFYPTLGLCYFTRTGYREDLGQKQPKKEVERNTAAEKDTSL